MVSLVSASLTKPQENDQIEGLNSWLYGDEELAPNVLEEGDSTQKIVKLSVDGTIAAEGLQVYLLLKVTIIKILWNN